MMKLYLLFGLPLALLISGAHMATLTLRNNCQFTIWPATLTGGGRPQLQNTGFVLAPQEINSINVPVPWTGRLWARTQCSNSSGRLTCATADCGSGQIACNGSGGAPPATLLEFTLAENGEHDFYDISLVDGFNLPASITPLGGSGPNCTTTSCGANVNSICPSELAVRGSDGNIIGCKTACLVFKQSQHCCPGEYASPQTCQPTVYSWFFENQCAQAYSYPYDDRSNTFSCTGGPNYRITFCGEDRCWHLEGVMFDFD